MRTIYVLGSMNADLAIATDKFPVEGETVNGHSFKIGCGGKGLNQAIAAAKLGGKVKFCGKIGKDSFGREMKKWLKINKVNTCYVKSISDTPSGVAEIVLNNNNNRIVLDLGANLKISVKDVDSFLLKARKGDVFVAQLENNISSVAYALKVAKEKGLITVLNPAPANIEIKQALNYVDYLIPNETEYEILKEYISNQKVINWKDAIYFVHQINNYFEMCLFIILFYVLNYHILHQLTLVYYYYWLSQENCCNILVLLFLQL